MHPPQAGSFLVCEKTGVVRVAAAFLLVAASLSQMVTRRQREAARR
ncbi:MAG: hypothetical protein FWC46_01800 [Actinomycetia bacterium]|nr:hypothetical protein [Actinomycetes bacterium]